MKRVLLLIKGLGRGGAEQLLVNAAPYLDRSRFQYEVAYLLPWKDALAGELRAHGLEVSCLGGGPGPRWITRLHTLVREHEIDLVHSHSPLAAVAVRLLLPGHSVRRVYTEHNLWERFHPATYWLNLLTFHRGNHVFAVSDNVLASIRYPKPLRFLPTPPLETLYHGPDPASVHGWSNHNGIREQLRIPADAPIVGTVANFKTHKGYRYLVEAAALVKEVVPDVRFVMVGQGPLEDEIRRRARTKGLDGTMMFVGYREDAPQVAGTFDLFALASLQEGLSIALIEAMAQGKPAVVTNVGGLPEVVEHEKQGLVVPPRDPKALARGIVRLLENDELRQKYGEAARSRAVQFDIRGAVKRMEEVYGELLA